MVIKEWLTEESILQFAVDRAKLIFDNPYFDVGEDLQKLESKTKKFKDIYQWLKSWSDNVEFKNRLGLEYLPILRCWIGAGNYYQLEKEVRKISIANDEHIREKGKNISLNRYFFWTNYQQYIVDYYILIPRNGGYMYDNINKSENFRYIDNGHLTDDVPPMIILKFDNYYFIQPLVLTATNCELTMTKEMVFMERMLQNTSIDVSKIKNLEPCLIHDFYFGWQQELVIILKMFDIHTKSNTIKVTEHGGKSFMIDINNPLDKDEKLQRESNLRSWYFNANRHKLRHDQSKLRQYAKNLTYHHII